MFGWLTKGLRKGTNALPSEDLLARFVRRVLPWAAFLILVAGGAVMAVQLWPNRLPDRGAVENIFDSRLVVWTVRMFLFIGVVYAGGSILALISQNVWLSDFGPFKATVWEAEEKLDETTKELEQNAQKIDDLTERLKKRDDQVRELTEEIRRLKGDEPGTTGA